jgi:predicted alpha/beta superfamily hydrolase
MLGKTLPFEKDGRPAVAVLPESADAGLPVIYMLAGPDPALELAGALDKAGALMKAPELRGRSFAAVAVGTTAWNSDYSPWPAPPIMDGEPPFTGGAGDLIGWLTRALIPYAEETFPQLGHPQRRILLGYSLAGLAALYAMTLTDAFSAYGCCSGSLWFDGWAAYMAAHRARPGTRVYLSLGKSEEKTKNTRLASVGNATRAAYDLLSRDSHIAEATLVWHDGGHFSGVPDRMAAAMTWLLG